VRTERIPLALVHDYLTQRGGGERVVEQFTAAFPGAPLFTALYEPSATFESFADVDVRTGTLNHVALLRSHHRLALPFLAPWFATRHVDADVVLAHSSGWAHQVRTDGRLVVYCSAPARWLYQQDRYLRATSGATAAKLLARAGLAVLAPSLRAMDRAGAGRADVYLANSTATAALVSAHYDRDAEVLCPPPALLPGGPTTAVAGLDAGFVLCVSRLLAYKHVDVFVEAAALVPSSLFVVVGDGPERRHLEHSAPDNVRFLGVVDDATLRWCYDAASVLVALGFEDFGLAPLEAASFGTPTVARRFGGFLDTIVHGVTGTLLDDVSARTVGGAITTLALSPPPTAVLTSHAATFSAARFAERLREVITGN
jgi:glycosyltransferase involved in cell wall biosynthesis